MSVRINESLYLYLCLCASFLLAGPFDVISKYSFSVFFFKCLAVFLHCSRNSVRSIKIYVLIHLVWQRLRQIVRKYELRRNGEPVVADDRLINYQQRVFDKVPVCGTCVLNTYQ
jgi:hypothetical protein